MRARAIPLSLPFLSYPLGILWGGRASEQARARGGEEREGAKDGDCGHSSVRLAIALTHIVLLAVAVACTNNEEGGEHDS